MQVAFNTAIDPTILLVDKPNKTIIRTFYNIKI